MRNSFGNRGPFVTAADVARVRAATANRKTMWTLPELEASMPVFAGVAAGLEGDREPHPATAASAVHVPGLVERRAAAADMWFQVELPAAVRADRSCNSSRLPAGGQGRRRGRAVPWRRRENLPRSSAPEEPRRRRLLAPQRPLVLPQHRERRPGRRPPPTPPPPDTRAATASPCRPTARRGARRWRRGRGAARSTVIAFAPVNAKFVRITQTAAVDGAPAWSIQRLRLYRAGR